MVGETYVTVHELVVEKTGCTDVGAAAVRAGFYVTADALTRACFCQPETVAALCAEVRKGAFCAVVDIACRGKGCGV